MKQVDPSKVFWVPHQLVVKPDKWVFKINSPKNKYGTRLIALEVSSSRYSSIVLCYRFTIDVLQNKNSPVLDDPKVSCHDLVAEVLGWADESESNIKF